MKKFLSIFTCLLLAASCEIPFELDQAGEAKIYVQGIVNNGEVFVTAQLAQPITGKVQADAPMEIDQTWDGDEFSLRVRTTGVEPVSGRTTVPPPVEIQDMTWQRVQVDTIDAVDIRFTLDHAPGEGEYYGIQILQHYEITYMDGTSEEMDVYGTPGYILTASESVSFDLEDFMQVNFDGRYLGGADYMPLTLVTQKQFEGKVYQFYLDSFDSSILDGIRERMPTGDTGMAGGGIISGGVGPGSGGQGFDPGKIPVDMKTSYTFTFYRLSREFFLYAKAMFQSNFDFLANMGLIPANFTWSNVEGGLGFVGAANSVTLGPFEFPKENENKFW